MRIRFTVACLLASLACAAQGNSKQSFTLSLPDPASHYFQVDMVCSGFSGTNLELTLPNWTPGYYQILNYAKYVENFKATDEKGKELTWTKSSANGWKISKGKSKEVRIHYSSKATIPFVANSLLDAEHGYIMPAGVFMHVRGSLNQPVTLTIHNYEKWSTIATGLSRVAGKTDTFTAPDFDTFYDSPILLGNLESLHDFSVKGIPHHFVGYRLGEFDKQKFIDDLQRIVTAGTEVIGDIPYDQYTFLAIGPVPGGIEHLNSTGFGFSSNDFNQRQRMVRMYTFLSHEYFHHYNVKRIRPVELGPFDYDNGSKTTMLWISEGFTNYYDELVVKRAGVISKEEYLKAIESRITSFENRPGRLFQTASEASYQTWSDGPFGRTGDDAYKTISVYEKGSLLGLVLDLTIRNYTQNKKSLDDVMRYLYQEYYQKKKRGFSESEFQAAAEQVAGTSLKEFFEYVNTVKVIDFQKYLSYAGLQLKEEPRDLPDPYLGVTTRVKNDTLSVSRIDWESPAWKSGIRTSDVIVKVNGEKATKDLLTSATVLNKNIVLVVVKKNGTPQEVKLLPVTKTERSFSITEIPNATDLQKTILKDWSRE